MALSAKLWLFTQAKQEDENDKEILNGGSFNNTQLLSVFLDKWFFTKITSGKIRCLDLLLFTFIWDKVIKKQSFMISLH